MAERNERLIAAAGPIVRALKSRQDIDRARRVDQAIDSRGNPIISGWPFLELRSPNGTLWRIRVDDAGNVHTSHVTS